MTMNLPYITRYLAGNYRDVTHTLLEKGSEIYTNPLLFRDAHCVASEVIRRVQHNIGLIERRLIACGYTFYYPERMYRLSSPDHEEELQRLQGSYGPLPLILQAFYTQIGQIEWDGHHPLLTTGSQSDQRPAIYGDPLNIEIDTVLQDYLDESIIDEDIEHILDGETFYYIGGDASSKGGQQSDGLRIPYPSPSFDTPIRTDLFGDHYTSLIEYLRVSLTYGGFAGLVRYEPLPDITRTLVHELTHGCLPF